ncbi:MlaA family lipoprotein [Paracandidimonas soli]|uniref:Phospholipid-binding lipoprotein MlaA n=1 Tax=Paracandidimonas soli TaxID=1917182 RepID=A0A4R3UYU9_9BURK|nr:VacJ family lipoprotein [Paracandidimonas soli]TCU95997.1 phospholipid-binding lipoprotein MlaA [Paracandidimonas soli]
MNAQTRERRRNPLPRLAPAAAAVLLATGCASVQNPHPSDPWEGMNRGVHNFNETIDKALLKPIAQGYEAITPRPARTCINNIFRNMGDLWSAVNSFAQGRGHDFINTLGRVLFNSTMGLGGCIDVASMNGAYRIENDFGVTLGVWGLDSGPYLVLPFLGASTLRDGVGNVGMMALGASASTPIFAIDDVPVRNSILGLYIVDGRAALLEADRLVDETALDRYSFIRDAYLQKRKAMVEGSAADDNLPDYSDDEDDLPADSGNAAQSQPAAAN